MAFVGGCGVLPSVKGRVRSTSVVTCSYDPVRHGRSGNVSRREWMLAVTGMVVGECLSGFRVEAKEEAPGLPPGALQFDRVLKSRKNWEEIKDVVSKKDAVLSDGEWAGVRAFLRKFYRIGDDMQYLSKSLTKENRAAADAVAKDFRKTVKDMDKPAENKNIEAFLELHKHADDNIVEFLELLKGNNNIPDEL